MEIGASAGTDIGSYVNVAAQGAGIMADLWMERKKYLIF